jgi:hypothetical protein
MDAGGCAAAGLQAGSQGVESLSSTAPKAPVRACMPTCALASQEVFFRRRATFAPDTFWLPGCCAVYALHQFAEVRACIGQGVPGMPWITEMDAWQASRRECHDPDTAAEVGAAQQ